MYQYNLVHEKFSTHWIINNKDLKMVESDALVQFREWIIKHKCRCRVIINVADAYFLMSDDERENLNLQSYNIDSQPISGVRPIYKDEQLVVHISFDMSSDVLDKFNTNMFKLTPNENGITMPLIISTKYIRDKTCVCGAYKRSHFDSSFNQVKDLKPDITEKDFCIIKQDWDNSIFDTELVTIEPYKGMKDCVELMCNNTQVPTGISRVTLSLRMIDIDINLEHLKLILFPMCDILDISLMLKYGIYSSEYKI